MLLGSDAFAFEKVSVDLPVFAEPNVTDTDLEVENQLEELEVLVDSKVSTG